MTNIIKPTNESQLRDAIAWAANETAPLEIVGTGTKSAIGRAMQTHARLDLSGFTGIALYEPEELVLTASAGTPLSEIECELAKAGQEFAFEPPDFSTLLGSAHAGTLGGVTAANLAGPRRIKAGAARDHFLGFRAVSGRGEAFKSGSRVMKNVTGYDLPKILAGSWGTLAAMSEVTFKVLPTAETQATLVTSGLKPRDAIKVLCAAMRSSCEISGAAYLPSELAGTVDGLPDGSACVMRLEGFKPSVAAREQSLAKLLKERTPTVSVDADVSRNLWRAIRNVSFFRPDPSSIVWRVSVPPVNGANVLETLTAIEGARAFMDWAGGLIWAELPASDHGSAQLVRGAIAGCGGHATLIRAPETLRAAIPVFEPQPDALAALSVRLKNSFDPKGVLNPGRMYA